VLGQGFTFHSKHLPPGSLTYSKKQFPNSERGFVRFDHGVKLDELPTPYWVNLDRSVIFRSRSGTAVGIPQVLLNYGGASNGPWRLKALIDRKGHAVTSRFIAVRRMPSSPSLEVLWALLNSPIANAYAFSHLRKRDNVVGNIRKIPVPMVDSFEKVERAATEYLKAASSGSNAGKLQNLMLQVDSEVLKLYSLPEELEAALLRLFIDWDRVGVPFRQARYVPKQLGASIRLSDFLLFEQDWPAINRERVQLIDKKISGSMNPPERARLDALQAYAEYHIDQIEERPASEPDDEHEGSLFSDLSTDEGHF
jgi:hypothetical protein